MSIAVQIQAALIVPVRNQIDTYLQQALESAAEQTASCEILVVVSRDGLASNRRLIDRFAERDPRFRVLEQARPGFPQALNEAIDGTRAPRFGILLSDDWLEATAIEDSLAADADITSSQMLTYAADGVTPVHRPWKAITNDIYRSKTDLEQQASYLQHFFLLSKAKVIEAGGVDESLGDTPGIDDFHLIWSMLEHGATARIIEKPLYNYRDHPGTRLTLRDRKMMTDTMARILRKHGLTGKRFEAALERHSIWFGRTMQEVIQDRSTHEAALPDRNGLLAGDYEAAELS